MGTGKSGFAYPTMVNIISNHNFSLNENFLSITIGYYESLVKTGMVKVKCKFIYRCIPG